MVFARGRHPARRGSNPISVLAGGCLHNLWPADRGTKRNDHGNDHLLDVQFADLYP